VRIVSGLEYPHSKRGKSKKLTLIISQQGHLLKIKDTTPKHSTKAGGGKRGNVTGFSAASRRRLLRLMATLDVDNTRTVFVTLTYHGFPAHETAKKNLKAFLMRVRRKFPDASAIWRLEYQERGSIHFHILFFNLPFWKYSDLQTVWTQITGEDISGIDICLVNDHKHAMTYVSKYVAKASADAKKLLTLQARIDRTARTQHSEKYPAALAAYSPTKLDSGAYQHATETHTGRVWGIFGKDRLPYAPLGMGVIKDAQVENYLKWAIKAETRIAHNREARTFYLFTDDAKQMLQHAVNLAQYSGKNAYKHMRIIQREIVHAERLRSPIPHKACVMRQDQISPF